MNYYWWKSAAGHVGNVYAKSEEAAIQNVEREFEETGVIVELLETNVKRNGFTGKYFEEDE